MKISVTGKYDKMGRSEIEAQVKAMGHSFTKHITKDTDILLCADPDSGSSKIVKAAKDGIKVVAYEAFFADGVDAPAAKKKPAKKKPAAAKKKSTAKVKAGSKVCVTGKHPTMGRKDIQARIEELGHVFSGGLTKDTDILLCTDPDGGSAKLVKAAKDGVTILSYDDFLG
jgi:NAD-dependent DNA ligase